MALVEAQINHLVMQLLFERYFHWEKELKRAEADVSRLEIKLETDRDWEKSHGDDFMSWSSKSSRTESEISQKNAYIKTATAEMQSWMEIIKYVSEKLGLEVVHIQEKEQWRWQVKQ